MTSHPARHKLLFLMNDGAYFVSHRLPIAVEALRQGYQVHVAAPGPCPDQVRAAGLTYHSVAISRSGIGPLQELRSFISILGLIRSVRPAILHAVTIKPVIYGGIAARLSGIRHFVGAIAGLGTVFIASGLSAQLRRVLAVRLYRLALGGRGTRVIFQNDDDRRTFLDAGITKPSQTVLIRGSGVALEQYAVKPEPKGPLVFVVASRLLRDKGIGEFVAAARLLRESGVKAHFRVVGAPDPGNPSSLTSVDLAEWQKQGIVEFAGYQSDIAGEFAAANVVVLPSYREGLPRVLLEAAACARATVTTDVPGCRDAISPDVTGILVPPRKVEPLAEAMRVLAEDGVRRRAMGVAGRLLAERSFGIEKVVSAHLELYAKLLEQD